MNKKYKYLIIVILIVASIVAFGRIAANDFINFDDNIYIAESNHIKSGFNAESIKWAFTSSIASNWHPLTWISHILDWQSFGANASGHHLVSLMFHIGSAILLFLFLSKTTGALWPSAFVAALFALHPLRVESVAWAAERKDVLSMFFGMAVIYTYALYVEKHKLYKYCLCLLLFALSLLSKPMLVTLPFVLMLLDYWPLARWQKALNHQLSPARNEASAEKKKGEKRKTGSITQKKLSKPATDRAETISSLLLEKAPFIFLSLASCIMTIWAQNTGGAIASLEKLQFTERIQNAIVSYVAYLIKIFWPANLAVFYPYEPSLPLWQVFFAASILLIISAAVIYFIKEAPFLFACWFWYLGTLVPVIGLVQVGAQAMADRYTYFPSIGIAIMLVWGVVYLLPKDKLQKIIIIPGAVILAALTFLTWQQCGYWKNSITLFTHTLNVTKDNYLAHNSLGVALAAEGKVEAAINHYREAIRINPYHDSAQSNLGAALASYGKMEEAIVQYMAAIKINPRQAEAHSNLGIALAATGRSEEAIKQYQEAIRINQGYDNAYYNLANTYIKQGKMEEAVNNYRKTISINPDHDDAHFNLADILARQGKTEEAIIHFREAVRIKPTSFAALNNLGVNLGRQQRHEEAIVFYRRAIQIEPNNPGIYFNLGVALGNKGELQEAITNFRQALLLKPDYQQARQALKLAIELEVQKR